MALISFSRDEVLEYIPEADRGSKDPTVVRMKFVPYSVSEHYARIIERKQLEAARGVRDADERARLNLQVLRQVQKQEFVENVVSIENYSVSGKAVTDPAEFYDTADGGLVLEIIRAMESAQKLNEGQRKNFAGPSATA